MDEFEQRTVFITGGAGGIGLEMARSFANRGAKVVISDIYEKKVLAAAAALRDEKLEVTGLGCDVTNEKKLELVLKQAQNLYGGIDVLINNAGVQFVSPIEEFPKEKFELLIGIMLTAPFLATKYVFPIMKEQRFGRIINMASINGLIGFAGKAAYNSAKHGVIGLTKVTALEGANYGITVNALCPGYVDTPLVRDQLSDLAKTRNLTPEKIMEEVIYPLVPQRRLLTVQEIANYALFLAGNKARGITGQAVVIDGGYTAQ